MPILHVIGGANGAGKTTTALRLLPDFLGCDEYVNADSIAQGLSPFKPESVAIQAGRLMLKRLHNLAASEVDFAFETTLASRSIVPFLEQCQSIRVSNQPYLFVDRKRRTRFKACAGPCNVRGAQCS